MLRIKIVKGLDLAPLDSELYLTFSVNGISRTSKVIRREKGDAGETTPSPVPSPSPGSEDSGARREPSLPKQLGWAWDEELDLVLSPTTKKDQDEIEVCCFDAHQACGKVRIPLARLGPNEPVQQWYSLMDSSNPKAAVMLKLTFVSEVTGGSNGGSPSRPKSKSPADSLAGTSESSNGAFEGPVVPQRSVTIPYGLADYFIVAGCNQETARQDRLRMLAKPRKKPHSFASHTISQMGADEYSQASVSGPDAVTLSPVLLDRYPATDRSDFEFPTKCEMFLLPDGAEIVKAIPSTARDPRFYTIAFVVNTIRMYGFCLETFEPLPRINKATDYEDLYAPVVLCFLTRLPLPSHVFRYILIQTHEARKRGWYERMVQAVIRSIPAPLPGFYSVDLDLLTREKCRASLPSSAELPGLVFPAMCRHVFEWFPLDSMIDLWIAALTERKILVHSHNREALAMVTEALVELMYPFTWEHTYIPVLPINLMQLFDSPIPAIMGMRTDGLKNIPNGGLDAITHNWIIADADKCTISFPNEDPLPQLPVELRSRLLRTIRMVLVDKHFTDEAKDRKIRLTFLECLASMLQGYRESFFVLSTDADASTVFNLNQFFQRQSAQKQQQLSQMASHIQHPAQSQVGDGGRDFLECFFGTTAFEQFKISQYHPETDFFHAVFASRRSKERERDQRAAALAVLQGEAESAAALLQQLAQGAPTSAATTAAAPIAPGATPAQTMMTTVVKVWSARESRWSEAALEPIDPASGRRRSSITMSTNIESRSPLEKGDRVWVESFGAGTVAEVQTDARICVVAMDWGAKGYFQFGSISRLTEDKMAEIHRGLGSPKLKSTNKSSNADEGSDEGSGKEDDEEDDLIMVKALPIKTAAERFSAEPVPLVDESILKRLIADDPEGAHRAEAHYRRILGLNAAPEPKAPRASAAARPPKSASDAKMERAMHRAITNIFQDKQVPENDLRECANNLANSQYARDMLVYVLKSQQSTHNSNAAAGTWLATPGRGRRLGTDAFASLHELFDSLLKACAAKEDYTNARCALEVSQYFYCEDETLQTKLKRHVLWSKPVFWEYAFAEQFALSLDKTKSVPEPPTLASDQAVPEAPAMALARFHELGKAAPPGMEDTHKQTLFENLSFFLLTMLNLDVSDEMARLFVDRVATVYSLEEDQKMTLNMLITNISRAASYNNEEERVQTQPQPGTDDGQTSPNSTSKRSMRKHYSVEALSNTMMNRFTRWGRTTKAKSPNMTANRRDSQTSQETT